MFKKPNVGQPKTVQQPVKETEISTRHYPVPQPPRDWAEAAAAAAQHEIDMQNKIHRLEDELRAMHTRNELVEEANKILHSDFDKYKQEAKAEMDMLKREHADRETKLTAARDKYLAQFLAMYTHLKIGGNTIVEALEAAKVVVEEHERENGKANMEFEKYVPKKHRTQPDEIESEIGRMFGAPSRRED